MSNLRPDFAFLILAFCFGLIFLLSTPPAQAPDDTEHFYRAYQVFKGDWIAIRNNDLVGGPLPKELAVISKMVPRGIKGRQQYPADVLKMIQSTDHSTQPGETMFFKFPNMALNFPFLYLPQALGIAIGKWFDASPIALNYLARLTNLLVWIAVVTFAIRIIPMAKWLLLIVALTPMSLFLATSNSADTLTYGICFLFIATVMNLAFGPAHLTKQSLLLVMILCVLVALSKLVYIALIMLVLLIPRSKFDSNFRYFGFTALCFALAIGMAFLWSKAVLNLYLPANPDETPDATAQIDFILSDPIHYLGILVSTMVDRLGIIARQVIGVFGWLDTFLPTWFYVASYAAIGLVALLDQNPDIRLRLFSKFIILATISAGTFLVFTGLYIKWTSVGSAAITGVQGRMFIPLFFLFWLLFYRVGVFGKHLRHYNLSLPIMLYCTVMLGYASWLLLNRYYFL